MSWLRASAVVCLGLFALESGTSALIPVVHASPESPANVHEVVEAVKATYRDTKSVRAEFLQVRRDKAMGTEDHQRGRLAMERPRKLRIETGFPLENAVVSNGTTLWVYNVKSRQVFETPEISSATGMGVLLEDLSKLDELYDVTLMPEKVPVAPAKPAFTVQLVPKQPGTFKSLELSVSKQKYVLQDLKLVDPLDNETRISFSAVRMNEDIPDAQFVFVPPPGVSVMKTGGL